jgi:major capsid protein E
MLTMDVFKQDAFSATSLTAAVNKVGYVPGFLGSIPGLFDPVPVRTKEIYIEGRETEAALIQTSPRGAPPDELKDGLREARPFTTRRIATRSRIMASELFGIREFGSETELKQLQTEIARRQFLMKRNMDLTVENLRLGCVTGSVLDADGSTIYNWATEFGQTIPAEVDFDLDAASPASGILRTRCTAAIRSMSRGLKGLGGNGVRFMSIAGDDFWDALISHKEVVQTYLNYQAAAALREPVAWESFNFGGITWTNYRGTDDGTTVAVASTKAKFFPVAAGIFQWAMAPGESFEHLGQMGQMFYSRIVVDDKRDEWADVEQRSYPLPVCTMPQALYRAKMT